MEDISELKDILYIKKSKWGITAIFFVLIFVLINLLFRDEKSIAIYIIQIIILVSNLCAALIVWSTRRLERDKLFNYIGYIYLISILANLIMFTVEIEVFNNKIELTKTFISHFLYLVIIYFVLFRCLFRYIAGIKINREREILKLLGLLLIVTIVEKVVSERQMIIIILLFCFTISLKNLIDIKSYKLFISNKINYIYMVAIAMVINTGVQFIIGICNIDIILRYQVGIINFVILNMLAIFITDTLLNDPYNTIFVRLYNVSNELKGINEEYIKKNKELEFSQASLRESENVIKALLKNLPIPLAIINYKTKRIIYANSLFLKLVNRKKLRDVINSKIFDFLDICTEDIFDENSKSKLSKCFLKKRSTEKYLTLEVVDSNKENGEIIISLIDVTSKVNFNKIQDDIKENEFRQTIRKNFLSNISHDLKTPINVIYSAMQLEPLFIKNKDKESLIRYTEISKKNCDALTNLANNIIDIGKVDSENANILFQKVDIVLFTEEIVQSLVYYAKEKDIELIFDTNVEEAFLNLDKNAMNRVIINIISNSIKFTGKSGKIITEVIEDDDSISINIEDTGIGMSENVLKNIYKRYNTEGNVMKVTEKGSGIGLYVVKRLVETQGGTVEIISEKGVGTKVTMVFEKGGSKNRRNKEIVQAVY